MLPGVDVAAAVEFPPKVFANLLLFALLVALSVVPPAPVVLGALLSIAAMALVAVASAPLLAVWFFTAFVFVAIVVVVSCAVTVQATRAARRIDE
jgi:hypothetical protein